MSFMVIRNTLAMRMKDVYKGCKWLWQRFGEVGSVTAARRPIFL